VEASWSAPTKPATPLPMPSLLTGAGARRPLDILGINRVIGIYPNLSDAITSLGV
jgi:hypothetical protein